jgi:hypothetical protein
MTTLLQPKSKRGKRSDKFPLTLNPTGQYCKKIKGKLHYFGVDKQQGLQQYYRIGCLPTPRPTVNA